MTMYSRLLSMQFHSFQRRLRFVVEVYVRIISPTDVWILGKYLRIHVEPNIQLRVSSGRYATIHSEQPNGREQMRGQKQQCVFECRNGKCAPAAPPAAPPAAHNVRNEHQPTIRLVTLLSFSLRSPSPSSLLRLGSVVPISMATRVHCHLLSTVTMADSPTTHNLNASSVNTNTIQTQFYLIKCEMVGAVSWLHT